MNITTSETLVQRIHQVDDQEAWDRLYQLYAPLVKAFAIAKGCKSTMADDVVQLTFVSLLKSLPRFQYQKQTGRFRSFIYTIVKRRIADLFEDQNMYAFARSDTEHHHFFDEHEDSRVEVPGENWDIMYENNLMNQALEEVKQKINQKGDPITLEIFDLYVTQRLSASEVGRRIFENHNVSINENKIYQDKSRVMQMWKDEVRKLKSELGD